MKRFFALFMALIMSLSIFAGCSNNSDTPLAAELNNNDILFVDNNDKVDASNETESVNDSNAVIVPDTTIMVDNQENEGADDYGNVTNNEDKNSTNSVVDNVENDTTVPSVTEPVDPSQGTNNNEGIHPNDGNNSVDNSENDKVEETNPPATEPEETKPQHIHEYRNSVIKATCTNGGYTVHTCSCGHSYTDSETKAMGHNYKSVVTAPKVGVEGYTTHTCKKCGDEYVDSYTDALVPETEPEITEPDPTEPPADHENPDDGPYDGDTAVPPDVNDPVVEIPKKCDEHDMVLVNTTIDTEYQLYNYVTDHYKCANCDYATTDVHIASAGLSKSELNSIESQIVSYVNALRAENGLPALWTSGDWNAWADTRAVELDSFYGHGRPNGGSWMTSIGANFTLGENISVGHASGYAFYSAFYNSASHRSIMLSADAVGIAVGLYVDEDGNTYCAMVLIA